MVISVDFTRCRGWIIEWIVIIMIPDSIPMDVIRLWIFWTFSLQS